MVRNSQNSFDFQLRTKILRSINRNVTVSAALGREKLLYLSVFDWWIVIRDDDLFSPVVYRLELNESAKTFSLVALTRLSFFDMYRSSFMIADRNKINIISSEMDSLLVYDLAGSYWLPKTLIKSIQSEFIENIYQPRPLFCNMSEDGKTRLLWCLTRRSLIRK